MPGLHIVKVFLEVFEAITSALFVAIITVSSTKIAV